MQWKWEGEFRRHIVVSKWSDYRGEEEYIDKCDEGFLICGIVFANEVQYGFRRVRRGREAFGTTDIGHCEWKQ